MTYQRLIELANKAEGEKRRHYLIEFALKAIAQAEGLDTTAPPLDDRPGYKQRPDLKRCEGILVSGRRCLLTAGHEGYHEWEHGLDK